MKFLLSLVIVGAAIGFSTGCGSKDNSNGTPAAGAGQPVTSVQQVQGTHWAVTSFQTRARTVVPDAQGYIDKSQIDSQDIDGQPNGRYRYYMSIDPTYMTFTQIDDQGSAPVDSVQSYSVQNGTFVAIDPTGQIAHMTLFITGQNTLDVRGESGITGHYTKLTDAQYAQVRSAIAPPPPPPPAPAAPATPNVNYPNNVPSSTNPNSNSSSNNNSSGPATASLATNH